MFGMFKSKKTDILSPVKGEITELESVNDEVFSQKMMGDGVAIIPIDGNFAAPIDGKLKKLFPTNHAYIVSGDNGLEVLVHIGLDTVELKGNGFEAVKKEGDDVKAGELVVRADLKKLESLGKDIVTPVIITEMGKYKSIVKSQGDVNLSDMLMEVK